MSTPTTKRTAPVSNKVFATARAMAALKGYRLLRTDPADGPVAFLLERHGLIREVRDLGSL